MKPVEVFEGRTRKRLAFLQNAYDINVSKKINSLWTASFRLPYSDEKNVHCQPLNLVKLWEVDENGKDQEIGLFRILPQDQSLIGDEVYVEYQLEHVLGVLIDDVMIGWHEVGNTGIHTNQVIVYVLNHQVEQRWALGTCEFDHQYLYGWQDENLLSALFSITKPFLETNYIWSFDTTVFPWRLNLVKANPKPVTDIRYRKNLKGFTQRIDPTKIVTRLYCYGYGQGDNKLTISSVNNGLPYLESPNSSKYGIITKVWTDERYTFPEALKAAGLALLKKLDDPAVTYNFNVAMHGGISFKIGDTIRIVHETKDELMIVQEFNRSDISRNPRGGEAVFGHGTTSINDSYANIAEKQRINETYSQGAESLFTDSQSENADPTYPLILTFNIPSTVVHVNEILFNASLTNFRAYSKGVAGGGGTTLSSKDGGGVDKTSLAGGEVNKTGSSGGGSTQSSRNNIDQSHGDALWMGGQYPVGLSPIVENEGHSHSILFHTHSRTHYHYVELPAHTHQLQIDPHTHQLQIDPHTHQIQIDPHTHEIEYGIFVGPAATSMSIYLDNVLIGNYPSSVTNLNLVASMVKDANGKIMRGNHTIKIIPNRLTRIECSFQIRLFTNSLGGHQY